MKKLFYFFSVFIFCFTSCNNKKSDDSFFETLKELELPIHSKTSFIYVMDAAMDTAQARKLQFPEINGVIEMPSAWQALGKITSKKWKAIVYNYRSESENNYGIVIYDNNGKKISEKMLEVNMPPNGQALAEYSEISKDLVITTYYVLAKATGNEKYKSVFQITEDGAIFEDPSQSEQTITTTANEGNPALRKVDLPFELTEKDIILLENMDQAGCEKLHGKDENPEYLESWAVYVGTNQKELVGDELMPDERTRYVFGVCDIYREALYTATLFRYTHERQGTVNYYLTTVSNSPERKVISKIKIIDPFFFATGEGTEYKPIVKLKFETDKHFSLYMNSGIEIKDEKYHIDDNGNIIKD